MSDEPCLHAEQLEQIRLRHLTSHKLTAGGQLIQGFAHDIGTPLSVLVTNLSVLSNNVASLSDIARAAQALLPNLLGQTGTAALAAPLDAAVRAADLGYMLEDLPDLFKESAAAARRVDELMRTLATFTRTVPDEPSGEVDLHAILESALALASNPLRHHAHVVREYGPAPPVFGVASELTEVFVYLLLNAAQAIDDVARAGTVTVSTANDAGNAVIRIRDTGAGISASELARVFDPFFTTRAAGDRIGMGLAVCAGIVARHGGSIGLASEPDVGTTVTVCLPAADLVQLSSQS